MDKKILRTEFERLLEFLKSIPNVSDDMLSFDGHSSDMELMGYFFYEGVLPGDFPNNCLDACRYVLGRVLEKEFGFEWQGQQLNHSGLEILIDLEDLDFREDVFEQDAFDVIEECFEAIQEKVQESRS